MDEGWMWDKDKEDKDKDKIEKIRRREYSLR